MDAITPIGAALHEPVLIWVPFVSGRLVVAQKLMKLFEEVAEASSPGSELNLEHHGSVRLLSMFMTRCTHSFVPSSSKPVLTSDSRRVSED